MKNLPIIVGAIPLWLPHWLKAGTGALPLQIFYLREISLTFIKKTSTGYLSQPRCTLELERNLFIWQLGLLGASA
jgi:hypothetical protein